MSAHRRGVPRKDARETRPNAVRSAIRGRVYRRRELGVFVRDDRACPGRRFRKVHPMKAASPPIFQVGHLERLPLGTSYPGIVAHVGRLLTELPGRPELVIDYTGVGRPVFDMFVSSGISPIGVVITSGTVETRHGVTWSVPKLNLVSRLQALLHEGRLKIQRELTEAE